MDQQPKTVLITGASAGIGAAIACRLAGEGYRVYGTTRRLANLENAPPDLLAAMAEAAPAAQRKASRHPVRFVELDVTSAKSVQHCVEQVMNEAGRIDVLINNAGYGIFGSVEDTPVEMGQKLFDTLVFGPVRMIQAVLPAMRQRRGGLIVNVASIAGRAVIPFQSHYSAAKAALEALTIGLRQELRPLGVEVTILEPTDINTRFNDVTEFCPDKESAYRQWAEPCWKVIAENLPKAPPPSVVAAKIAAILRRKKHKVLYTCGIFYQRIAPGVFKFLPKKTELALMRMIYGLK
jgi:NAD(P)-dependent dehydrogenase (short-subunit alcohol dehydrogenase family)